MTDLKYATIDDKKIAYHSETEFLIQVGKGSKGAYKTKYKITGNFSQAWIHYTGINIDADHKKRLLMPSCTKNPVISRVFGYNC